MLVLSKPVLLDDAPRRMVWIGQLGESIHERGPALFHRPKLGGGSAAPVLELALGISTVLRHEILPIFFLVRDDSAHPFRNQLVLRLEVAVKGHLVRLRGFGNRLDAHAPDALFVKQVTRRHEDALPDRDCAALFLGLGAVVVNICLHDS